MIANKSKIGMHTHALKKNAHKSGFRSLVCPTLAQHGMYRYGLKKCLQNWTEVALFDVAFSHVINPSVLRRML